MHKIIKFRAYQLGDPIGQDIDAKTLEEFSRILHSQEYDTVYKIAVVAQESDYSGSGIALKNNIISYYIADEIKNKTQVGADFEKHIGPIFPAPLYGNMPAIITGYRPHPVIGLRMGKFSVPRSNLGYDVTVHDLDARCDKVLDRNLHQIYPSVRRQIPAKLRNFIKQKQK